MTLDPKEIVRSDNTAAADVVVDLSHAVWDTPEIAFEEYKTAEMTSRVLADAGFEVETEIADLPTAWSATYGNGELTVTISQQQELELAWHCRTWPMTLASLFVSWERLRKNKVVERF
jgi:hypothetical protein